MAHYLSPDVYVRETDFRYYVKQISTTAAAMIGVAERGPINKVRLVTSWEQFQNTYGGYIADGYLAYAARAFFDNGGHMLYVNRVAHLQDPSDRTSLTAKRASVTLKGQNGHAASITTGTAGVDAITWTAKEQGASGNTIRVSLVAMGATTPLSVSIYERFITVYLATTVSSVPTSRAHEVVNVVANTPQVALVVTATTSDTGLAQETAFINLSGGADATDTLRIQAVHEGAWGNDLTVKIENGTLEPHDGFNLVVRHKGKVVEVFKDLTMDETNARHVELMVNDKSTFITVEALAPNASANAGRPAVGQYVLAGGLNGLDDMSDADYIGDPAQRTGMRAFDAIEDINMIMIPGVTTAPVLVAAIAYCENRKDLMCIADTPLLIDPLEAIDFRKGQGQYSHGAFNSSYAALYYPWLEISDPPTGQKKWIPPCGAVAGCFARNDHKSNVWSAPAGIDRGRVFNTLSVAYTTSRAERDALYPEAINVIAVFPDTGINIWGQRTLQAQPSALDRINVRRLMMYVEEAIAQSSRFVVFEPNNPQTWRVLKRLINPFLQDIKEKGGLYDFAVQCDEETNTPAVIDRNELVCRIFLKPTKTAEFVELNFILSSTGTDFTEVFGA